MCIILTAFVKTLIQRLKPCSNPLPQSNKLAFRIFARIEIPLPCPIRHHRGDCLMPRLSGLALFPFLLGGTLTL